jgi:alcohol dehydrogenase class IV
LPARLRDAGVRHDQISAVAKAALANLRVKTNIRPIDTEQAMTQLIEAAF